MSAALAVQPTGLPETSIAAARSVITRDLPPATTMRLGAGQPWSDRGVLALLHRLSCSDTARTRARTAALLEAGGGGEDRASRRAQWALLDVAVRRYTAGLLAAAATTSRASARLVALGPLSSATQLKSAVRILAGTQRDLFDVINDHPLTDAEWALWRVVRRASRDATWACLHGAAVGPVAVTAILAWSAEQPELWQSLGSPLEDAVLCVLEDQRARAARPGTSGMAGGDPLDDLEAMLDALLAA